ncbi:MAG: hypothetical protein JWQ29_2424 [Phenylobacterium sp.]|nr:hypothetical protein [Phenylobacterium sp.]
MTANRWTSALASGLIALAALPVAAFYAGRILDPLPLYAFDEGSYLIRALFGARMAADPTLHPNVPELTNSAFFAIQRAIAAIAEPDLPWIRALSLVAYLGGLCLVWLVVRPRLPAGQRFDYLLLALLFPFYRFVVTGMPEGWYVGMLGLIVWTTDRLYDRRPALHAAAAGVLAATLCLIKPHGIAIVAALAVLPVLDVVLGERRLRLTALRLGVFVLAWLATGNLIQGLAHAGSPGPLLFFQAPFYVSLLNQPAGPNAWALTGVAVTAMAGAAAMFAGVPILAGLLALGRRWRAERTLRLEAAERPFVLLLLAFAATLAMVAAFSFRATAFPSEVLRTWGRYFESFTPLIWLAAAPMIAGLGGRWRIAACGLTLAGLAALLVALHAGIVLFPWDSSALTAFYSPDPVRFSLATTIPFRALASAAMAAAALAMLTRLSVVRIWQLGFLALALLSTGADWLWVDAVTPSRRELLQEVQGARAVLDQRPGRTLAVVDEGNADRILFLELQGRPHMHLVAPGDHLLAWEAAPYRTLVVQGAHPVVGASWRPLRLGRQVSVYASPAAP